MATNKKVGTILLLLLLASGCTTGEKQETPPVFEPSRPKIDLLAVQHDLGMDPELSFVGFNEKRFDACRYAQDLPNIRDCSHAYFVQVGVQLSCRPAEEAENSILSQGDLTPVANRDLRWRIGNSSGEFRTDPAGHGVILAITSGSMKQQHLRISTGEDFLVMSAKQATQIVTPVSWCK